jgi:dihydroorotate dehydrogenase
VAGIVATNTTVERPGAVAAHARAGEAGGLSGAPLAPLATRALRRVYARAGGRVPIVGVGGIFSAEDAYARIRSGATLVQVYTGYIYGGPRFVPALLRGLRDLLKRDGFSYIGDAVGVDSRRGLAA